MMNAVFIYGASRGIGAQLANIYAGEGRFVYGIGRSARSEISHANFRYHSLDGTTPDLKLPEEITSASFDRVFLNAAVFGPNPTDPLAITVDDLRRVLDCNLISHFAVLKRLLPSIKKDGTGKVIFTISKGGLQRGIIGTGAIAYRVSKAAQIALALALVTPMRSYNLSMYLLNPGSVTTRIGGRNARTSPEQSASRIRQIVETEKIEELTEPGATLLFDHDGTRIVL